ncbi:MAG: protein kinase [Planctomycetes bacterium]|nr:protein kinase [Planctomycetota bacterium]
MSTQRIGNYQVLDLLGQGGMGAVFRCRAPDGSEVAVKTLLDDERREPDRAQRRFRREVNALARLAHPNLIRVLDVGEHAGSPFLVMPLIEGRSLREHLDTLGALGEDEAARMFHKLALALAYAHRCGVLHRDIKPDNVIVRPDGEPVLVDFGLVKDEQLDASHLTRTGAQIGTPGYWSMEQMQGKHELVDARSDVYGLGATLYAALTGRPPYAAESWADLVQQVKRPPVPPSKHRRGLDPRLEQLVMRSLARDPNRRYPTADAMARDLAFYLHAPHAQPRMLYAGRGLVIGLSVLLLGLGAAVFSLTRGLPGAQVASTPEAGSTPTSAADGPGEAPLAPLPQRVDLSADRAQLLRGLSYLPAACQGGVPGPVVTFNPRSVVLFSGPVSNAPSRSPRHEALAVAARHGAGRVVAIGHPNYLKARYWPRETEQDASAWIVAQLFLRNCVSWAGGKPKLRIGVLEVEAGDALTKLLEGDGHEVVDVQRTRSLSGLDLVVWRDVGDEPVFEAAECVDFVERGGGLIVGVCPWGQQQLSTIAGKGDWRDALVNRILAPMGLAFNRHGYLRAPADGRYPVDEARQLEAHTLATLREVWGASGASTSREGALIQLNRAVEGLPRDGHALLPWIGRAFRPDLEAAGLGLDTPAQVGTSAALALVALMRAWEGTPGRAPADLPFAEAFPGAATPNAPMVRRKVVLEREQKGWVPTGLYARPDVPLEVRQRGEVSGGVAVRIGAHLDPLWNQDHYVHYPQVSRRWVIDATEAQVVSPFGGLVYLERLGPGTRRSEVHIEGAVEAPCFRLEAPESWGGWPQAREAPGAWGELIGERVVLTLPRALLSRVNDPRAVCAFWDGLLARGAAFAGSTPPRPLRLVYAQQEGVEEASPVDPAAVVRGAEGLARPELLAQLDSSAFDAMARALVHPAWDVPQLRRGQRWLLRTYLYSLAGGKALRASSYPEVTLFVDLVQTFGIAGLQQAFSSYAELPATKWPRSDSARLGMFYERLCDALNANLEQRFRRAKVVPPAALLLKVTNKGYPEK